MIFNSERSIQDSAGVNKNTNDFIWKVEKQTPSSKVRTVKVSAKYCPGIFSKIVGVLTLNNFDIFNAISYRHNDKTSHIFNVRAIPGQVLYERGFDRAKKGLEAVLAGKLNLSFELRRMPVPNIPDSRRSLRNLNEVVIKNEDTLAFSIIEVSANDFPGVLFRITDEIFRCGFYVWTAKINTKENRVFDVFYVKDAEDQKINSSKQIATIKTAIKNVL